MKQRIPFNTTRRPLDPRKCPIGIDANAINRDGSAHDQLVDRLLELDRSGTINLIVPRGVRIEVQDPRTPSQEDIRPMRNTSPRPPNIAATSLPTMSGF